jgi:hypothetical protein
MDIGIIAEEDNDLEVLYELTCKLINRRAFSFKKKFIAHGCGTLRNKCMAWAKNLLRRGCSHLVIMHDLDTSSEVSLRNELAGYVNNVGFQVYIILIPVHEIEAWLLIDASALKKVFNMPKLPKVPHRPEDILEPKERLGDIIWRYSKRRYINTIHNKYIAKELNINSLNRKCDSFVQYPRFIAEIFGLRQN